MHLSIIPWPFVVKIVCELCVHTENSKKKKSTLNTPMMHLKKWIVECWTFHALTVSALIT